MSGFVGLDPVAASGLAIHLEEAAVDLEAHADRVARLLVQADITPSNAPAEIRDVAAWARYRSRDLRRRIDKIVAAAGGRNALDVPGFRFANRDDARKAGRDEANKVWGLIRSHNRKKLGAELDALKRYGNDPAYVAGFFKGLGLTRTYALLTATAGRDSAVIVGRALVLARKTGGITAHFIDGIVEAARKAAEGIQAYTGALSDEDRVRAAQDEYVRRAGSPHPTLTKYLEAIQPLVPYLEAGAKVAVIGGAVVVVTMGAVGVGASVEIIAGTSSVDAGALQELEEEFSGLSVEIVQSDAAVETTRSLDAELSTLSEGRSPGVRVVESAEQLDDLFDRLSSGGDVVDSSYPGKLVRLPDGSTVGLRAASRSGGPAIDIVQPGEEPIKIHVDPWPPTD